MMEAGTPRLQVQRILFIGTRPIGGMVYNQKACSGVLKMAELEVLWYPEANLDGTPVSDVMPPVPWSYQAPNTIGEAGAERICAARAK
jgi:hypothetical protein